MPGIIGSGSSQPYSPGEFKENEVFPEFFRNLLRKVPAVLGACPK